MKVVLSTLIAMIGISVAPKTLEERLAQDSSKKFMDCICCLPEQGRIVQVPSLSVPRRAEPIQSPGPTLTPPPMPQSEIVQQQQPLTVPQNPIELNTMNLMQSLQAPSIPIQFVAARSGYSGGCGGGGGGSSYYNYRRFPRLRRG